MTYCVKGGGRVVLVFDRRKRLRFIASTARRHRRLGVGPRSRARRLRRGAAARRGRPVRLSPGVYRLSGRLRAVVFGVRRGRVRYIAVADRRVVRRRAALRSYARRAGLLPRLK